MKLRKITETDLQGVGVVGMADTPNLSARQMQEKVEEVVRSVVIPVINENIDYTATKQDLADAVYNAGAGDMQAAAYDSNLDGIVNSADNGIFTYTHSKSGTVHNLQGSGENMKFVAVADWNPGDSLTINGRTTHCLNNMFERVESEELFKQYAFVTATMRALTDYNRCFFKLGGAGLNFKVVGGTTQPASPKENTFWVNTNVAISSWDMSVSKPNRRSKNKNLLVYPYSNTTHTTKGITFTDNGDGTVTVNGTATANVYFEVSAGEQTCYLQPGKYTLSGCPAGGSSTKYSLIFRTPDSSYYIREMGTHQTFVVEKEQEMYCYIHVQNGQTVTNLTFRPQVEKAEAATSFVKGDATGQVWIKTGETSSVEINTVKKNGMFVRPQNCKQWNGTSWVNKEAKIYKAGRWKNFYRLLIDNGSYTSLSAWTNTSGTMTNNTTYNDVKVVKLHNNGQQIDEMISEAVDMTDFTTLELDVITSKSSQAYQSSPYVAYRYGVIAESETRAYTGSANIITSAGKYAVSTTGAYPELTTVKMDITSLKGKYKVAVVNQSSGGGIVSEVGVAGVRLV